MHLLVQEDENGREQNGGVNLEVRYSRSLTSRKIVEKVLARNSGGLQYLAYLEVMDDCCVG